MKHEYQPDTCFRCGEPLGMEQSADGQHPRCAAEDRQYERGCTISIAEALQYLRRVGFIHESREIARIIEANSTCIAQPAVQ